MNKKLLIFATLIALFLIMVAFVSAEEAAEEKKDDAAAAPAGGAGDDAAPAKQTVRRRPAKRSIFQACRKDIEALCMNNKDGESAPKKGDEAQQVRRKALRNAAMCLEEKKDDVKEDTCKSWLNARDVCFKDTETACPGLVKGEDKEALKGKAKNASERGRKMMCLRQAASEKFTSECTESDFYKAILGMRRFARAGKNKQGGGAGKAHEVKQIAKKMAE